MPETHLEEFEGELGAISLRVHGQSWESLRDDLLEGVVLLDRERFPLFVAFDVLLANTDRHERNVLLHWNPPGRPPGVGDACATWLIDFGWSALWPPGKWGVANMTQVDPGNATVAANFREAFLRCLPAQFRTAMYACDRARVVDEVQQITEDQIAHAVDEVPADYLTADEKALTIALLVARRRRLATILEEVFPA